MLKHKLTVVIFLVIGLSLFGCARKDAVEAGPVVIKVAFWGGPDDIEIITSVIDEWQAKHPEIKVKLEHTPYRGYADKLLTRIAGRGAPDIICTEVDLFVTFQTKNVLLNLSPFVEKDPDFDLSGFFPEIIDRFAIDGSLYCVPRDTAPYACVYYNKKVSDKAKSI